MPVTTREIDEFLDRLMNEEPGPDYTERLGRKWWYLERKAGEIYGCPSCQPEFQKLYNVKHNTVNLGLDKPVVDPKLYEEGMKLVLDSFKKYLDMKGEHFSENVKIGGRMVHVVTDEPGGIEALKGTKVAH
jgi:hypothetical protein